MNEVNVVFVSNYDDWEGIYLNGKCIIQDHKISAKELMSCLLFHGVIQNFSSKSVDWDWLDEHGWLPEKLEEVKFTDDIKERR